MTTWTDIDSGYSLNPSMDAWGTAGTSYNCPGSLGALPLGATPESCNIAGTSTVHSQITPGDSVSWSDAVPGDGVIWTNITPGDGITWT